MYKQPHHQRVFQLLQTLDGSLLEQSECYFGGGTAIALSLDEYRESVDIALMCASAEGYRTLRNIAYDRGLAGFFTTTPKQLRDLKADRYGIRTFIEVDDTPIKFEIIREDRIPLSGEMSPIWGIPALCRADMYAEKLLANTDRYADISTASRDIIDLALMIQGWGPIPEIAWEKVGNAYGESAGKAFNSAIEMTARHGHLAACLKKLQMDDSWLQRIPRILSITASPDK
ncbi:MAG: nucleotidyl transferase AbiEii/AbiGii toxin family protein [Sulfurimicrobium sp.]|nr:nucleotidyl transferase AbiEii/AbiGii toxin family protein [Sulfurimicrobium sp.]